jgi:hypothetical protein
VVGDLLDAELGQVEVQPLAQPAEVDRLVGDQVDLVLAGERGGDAGRELLAAAAGRPVPVVDADPHRRPRLTAG